MKNDRRLDALVALLTPSLSTLGFRKSGKLKFVAQSPDVEKRYILSVRHPRYSGDPHDLYVAPCVHVFVPKLEAVAAALEGSVVRKGFPTVGGSIGLFSAKGSYLEYPVDTEEDAGALASLLVSEINSVAVPFWAKFSSVERIAEAAEAGDPWLPPDQSWIYKRAALILLTRGEQMAEDFLRANELRMPPPTFRALVDSFGTKRD